MLSISILRQMRYHKLHPPAPLQEDLTFKDRTILVTGASSGIGPVAAELLARHHASQVILAVRNVSAGERVAADLKQKHAETIFTVMQIDMSSYQSIIAFVEKLNKDIPRLDVAILNAGTFRPDHKLVTDGWEETLMVNTVGTSLLGLLLLPRLKMSKSELRKKSDPYIGDNDKFGAGWPHLVFVSSRAHTFLAETDLPEVADKWSLRRDWSDDKKGVGGIQYSRSKLALEWAVQHICKLAISTETQDDPEVIVNTVCPGPTFSELGRDVGGKGYIVDWARGVFASVFMRTTEEGTRGLIKAATVGPQEMGVWWVDDSSESHGEFVNSEKGLKMSDTVWKELTSEWEEKNIPGVREALSMV